MNNGWIKLHRQFRESPYYKEPNAKSVWIECLLRATHTDDIVFLKRQKVFLKAGEFCMGREEFGNSIGISGSTAWYWLLQFEVDSMVDIKKTAKGSIVSVKNWLQYQIVDSTSDNKKTADEQQMNTNKKGKKIKNDKETKNNVLSEVDERIVHCLTDGLRKTNPIFAQKYPTNLEFSPKLDSWAKEISKMRSLDKVTEEQILSVIRWIFEGTSRDALFWRPNIQSASKLREKFQMIVAIIGRELQGGGQNKVKFAKI